MARSLILACLVWCTFAKLPPWVPTAALGFMEGFLSDNATDFDSCMVGLLTPLADIKQGIADVKEGWKDGNLTTIGAGLEEIGKVSQDLPPAMEKCKYAEADIKAIKAVVKSFHNLTDIIKHFGADFRADTAGVIGAHFELMIAAWKQKQYDQFGSHAGKMMHHLLIGPEGVALRRSILPPWVPTAALSFAEGFLSSNPADFDSCMVGALAPLADIKVGLADIKEGLKEHNATDIEDGFASLGKVATDLPPAMQSCKAADIDVQAIEKVVKQFHGLKDIIQHIKSDFGVDDQGQIMAQLELMVEAFKQQQYDKFGNHAGQMMHRLVIGKFPSSVVIV